MSDVHVEHRLGRDEACERLAALARKHGLKLTSSDGGYSGTLEKALAFVGSVRGRFRVLDDALEVDIEAAPAFPSAETIRRGIADELSRALSG